jgi:O-antigen/teichoic acid export membrane protein
LETLTASSPPKVQVSRPNLAGSIGKNTLFGIVASVVQIGTRVVTVPIILSHLGLGGFGIWSIVLTTATYMRFGSIGIKSAFQKYVAEATGNGNYEYTSKLLSTGSLGMLVISILGLIPTAIFSRDIARISGVPPEFLESSAWAISVLAIIMLLANSGAAYEAIVMGGHRIDLTRKFATTCYIFEAVATVFLLYLGYGLFAMAAVMAVSEFGFLVCCYVVARRVVPEVHVHMRYVTRSVVRELVRFAGSYQVVSILQLTYGAIMPIAILRVFGANESGVLALANRLITPVFMCMYAFMLPILSGGAMVYASGSVEKMRELLTKSFKVTLAMNLIPLALIAAFGTYLIQAWTGETDPTLRAVLWITCLSALFQSFALLGLVMYRVSGKAVMDNIREVLRIVVILPFAIFAHRLSLLSVLGGITLAEFVGMTFMMIALRRTFRGFGPRIVLPDALKLTAATAVMVACAAVALHFSPTSVSSPRLLATIEVSVIGAAVLASAYPALWLTGALSKTEVRAVFNIFSKKVVAAVPASE